MLKVFFKGGSDKHLTEVQGRNVLFTRADDEALPYAFVSEDEAQALDPDLFEVPGVEPVSATADKPEKPADAPKRGRKARA